MAFDYPYQQSLIKTKYSKPGVGHSAVPRLRISEKLNQAFAQKVTVVSAPAGYGKSTAVLDWINDNQLRAAWVSLDAKDNDPVVLWQYISSSLDSVVENISSGTHYVFSSQELFNSNIHLSIIIDRLNTINSSIFLVLDDFHNITEPRILESISYFINYLPPPMHLILISRSEPDLELARLKLNGELTRLTMDDLRFQTPEILQFYEKRGFSLDEQDLESIERYSEGWAAALVAVAMSMDDKTYRGIKKGIVSNNSGLDQYFLEEVYNTWSEERQDFFMKTAILDELCGDLCDAVTGYHTGTNLLKTISRGNSFLISLDEKNGWYRYHHIFREFLQNQLVDSQSSQLPDLHQKSAFWFQQNGYPFQAIEHFLIGGHYEAALELIDKQGDWLTNNGDYATAISWINRLPEHYRETSLGIAEIYSYYYAEIGSFELSSQWNARMKDIYDDSNYLTEESRKHVMIRCYLAQANLSIRKRNIAGLYSIIDSIIECGGHQFYQMSDYMDCNFCDIYFYRSPFNELTKAYGKTTAAFQEMVGNYRTLIPKNPGYAPLAAGEYLYEQNRLDEAMNYLLSALQEATNAACPGAMVPALVTIARINRAHGNMRGALAAVQECDTRLESINKMHWNYLLKAFKARLHLESGDIDAAESWFESCKLGIYQEITSTREFEFLVYARFLMARDSLSDADIVLKRLLTFAEGSGRKHSLVEILNLLAIASFKNGEKDRATEYLEKSIAIGMDEGYIRSFADEKEPMAILLAGFTVRGKEQKSYIQKLYKNTVNGFRSATERDKSVAVHVPKQLTPREYKVLQLLADGYTNDQIADQLNISNNTAKVHTKNIYSKLQVTTRVQCINQARNAGLLG